MEYNGILCKWCDMPIHKDINSKWEHDHNGMYNCDGKEGTAASNHRARPELTEKLEKEIKERVKKEVYFKYPKMAEQSLMSIEEVRYAVDCAIHITKDMVGK